MTTVKSLVSNESDISYQISYALILLDEDNLSTAQTVVNNMPSSSPEKADFVSLFNVMVYARQNNLNLSELPETQLNSLESLDGGRSLGAYHAQAILSQYYSRSFPLVIENDSTLEFRTKKEIQIVNSDEKLIILPNPVFGDMIIRLSDINLGIKEISVMTTAGVICIHKMLDGKSNSSNLITDKLNSGLYLIQVKNNNDFTYTNKFIKK